MATSNMYLMYLVREALGSAKRTRHAHALLMLQQANTDGAGAFAERKQLRWRPAHLAAPLRFGCRAGVSLQTELEAEEKSNPIPQS